VSESEGDVGDDYVVMVDLMGAQTPMHTAKHRKRTHAAKADTHAPQSTPFSFTDALKRKFMYVRTPAGVCVSESDEDDWCTDTPMVDRNQLRRGRL
jgi:hypothetical protein